MALMIKPAIGVVLSEGGFRVGAVAEGQFALDELHLGHLVD